MSREDPSSRNHNVNGPRSYNQKGEMSRKLRQTHVFLCKRFPSFNVFCVFVIQKNVISVLSFILLEYIYRNSSIKNISSTGEVTLI